jgi:hypothetical protein
LRFLAPVALLLNPYVVRRFGTLVLTLTSVAAPATLAQEQVAASPPVVRLWATREGLVGKTTAGGHLITPNDHFVALPSRKALNKTVIVAYKGKNITAPVLDIGPWNRDEAWWETGAARGQFQDLPRFVPEVWAAYENGYNGGRDAVGRYVTFPAMIDLGDGVYADLGMTAAADLLGGRRPARNPGVRAGEVFAVRPGHAREHSGAQRAEGRAVPEYLLLRVRPSLDRRPGAPGVRSRTDLDSGGDRCRRRAGLGRTGAQHALPAIQQDRLAHAGRAGRCV